MEKSNVWVCIIYGCVYELRVSTLWQDRGSRFVKQEALGKNSKLSFSAMVPNTIGSMWNSKQNSPNSNRRNPTPPVSRQIPLQQRCHLAKLRRKYRIHTGQAGAAFGKIDPGICAIQRCRKEITLSVLTVECSQFLPL